MKKYQSNLAIQIKMGLIWVVIGLALIWIAGFFQGCAPMQVNFTDAESTIHVVDVVGTKDELYLKANSWMVKIFNNAASVVQHSDKQEGVILGKYLMHGDVVGGMYGSTTDARIFAMIDIRVKDARARIEIKPLGPWKYDSSGLSIFDYSKQKAISDMQNLVKSFEIALNEEAVKF